MLQLNSFASKLHVVLIFQLFLLFDFSDRPQSMLPCVTAKAPISWHTVVTQRDLGAASALPPCAQDWSHPTPATRMTCMLHTASSQLPLLFSPHFQQPVQLPIFSTLFHHRIVPQGQKFLHTLFSTAWATTCFNVGKSTLFDLKLVRHGHFGHDTGQKCWATLKNCPTPSSFSLPEIPILVPLRWKPSRYGEASTV